MNTNSWNRFRYTLYSPVYDYFAFIFKKSRKKSIDSLDVKPGEKVLIVGAGTGLDLEFLPASCEIYATDITPSMVKRISERNRRLKLNVQVAVMDGQVLGFADNFFDKVILHLILAVIPDPIACLKESERVLKHGGRLAVYDKFVRKGRKASRLRKFINLFANVLMTDIARDFDSILSNSDLNIVFDKPADFRGNFRLIQLEKNQL
jgi:ubiquinone/menaquinone biosynthesis C-methylase UbiE